MPLSLFVLLLAADPDAELRAVQAERVKAGEEVYRVTAELYRVGAVSEVEYQAARVRLAALKSEAAATPEERRAAAVERAEAAAARVKLLSARKLPLTAVEFAAVVPTAKAELVEAKVLLADTPAERVALLRAGLAELDELRLPPRAEDVLSAADRAEIRLLRLTLKARMLDALRQDEARRNAAGGGVR